MYRFAFAAGLLTVMLPSTPSFAVTPKDKMATCKFGADDQKLAGAARTEFIKNAWPTGTIRADGAGAWLRPSGTDGVPPPPKILNERASGRRRTSGAE